jgi:hypothetical protein
MYGIGADMTSAEELTYRHLLAIMLDAALSAMAAAGIANGTRG